MSEENIQVLKQFESNLIEIYQKMSNSMQFENGLDSKEYDTYLQFTTLLGNAHKFLNEELLKK